MSFFARVFCIALPLALFLPFDPQWPDFERARRGVLLLLVGAFALTTGLARSRTERASAPLVLFALASCASIFWARDRWAAGESAAYATALAILPFLVPEAGSGSSTGARKLLAGSFATSLFLVAAYGIAQGLGFAWPADYTVPHEPVSTFGNRNVAAEVVAASTPLALAAPPVLGVPAVVAGAAYLGLNGGRAGLLAFVIALVAVFASRLRRHQLRHPQRVFWSLGLLTLLAFTGGHLLRTPAPTASDAPTTSNETRARPGDTIEVRRSLYSRTFELAKAKLPLGTGAGNFRVEFPAYRDPREIAISSQNHSFGTRVVVAHDDPLQLLAELGVAGALVLVLVLWSVLTLIRRDRLSSIGIAALAAWVPLTLLRAPLYNASACAALLVTLAACTRPSPRSRKMPRFVGISVRLLAIPLLAMGSSLCFGEAQGAAFFRSKLVNDPIAGADALDSAVRNDPFEADWRLLRAQLHHQLGAGVPLSQLASTFDDLYAVLARRPFEYKALVDMGFLGLEHPDAKIDHKIEGSIRLADRGRAATATLLEIDPDHPQGLFLGSEYAFLQGNFDAGLAALERLGDLARVEAKLEQLRKLFKAASNPDLRIQLARVQLALDKLRAKLAARH
ncbi:MAG: O-antigen ligase family protein [Planctomycetes bacterium]|nr:O-antigen ligase family protein [Planctomycetota bacterium]MCB9918418.1 O-antigen ligase family protein [Planctomycetota bacterium]